MRQLFTLFSFFLVVAPALIPPAALAAQQADTFFGPLPVFELHSGFWMNLHHTLYQQAREKRVSRVGAANSTTSPRLSEAERRDWDAAVAYYAANFANKDLLFSTELILLKNQLGDFEDCD